MGNAIVCAAEGRMIRSDHDAIPEMAVILGVPEAELRALFEAVPGANVLIVEARGTEAETMPEAGE
jgi:hypothetical protein